MPRENKVSKIELELRLQIVAGLIYKGYTHEQIRYYVNKPPLDKETGEYQFNPWNISIRQIDRYVSKCVAIFKENIDQDIDTKIAGHIAIRRDMFREAREAGDMSNALKIQQDIANLEGLYKLTIESRIKQEITIIGAPPPDSMPVDNPNAGINGAGHAKS